MPSPSRLWTWLWHASLRFSCAGRSTVARYFDRNGAYVFLPTNLEEQVLFPWGRILSLTTLYQDGQISMAWVQWQFVNAGVTDIQKTVPARYLLEVLEKYAHAITRTFGIATVMMSASTIGSFAMEWKNIKKSKKPAATATSPKLNEMERVAKEKKEERSI
jgi:hypothetical protein